MPSDSSVKYIIKNKCSVSRYGEGEFIVMGGGANGFQKENLALAKRLQEVLKNPIDNHIIGIPYTFVDLSPFRLSSKIFILEYLLSFGEHDLLPFLNPNLFYIDSLFTRFYMPYRNKIYGDKYVELLKKIWDNRNVLIVEGRYSRLGIGNDLFNNTKSIIRILCPEKNAFDKYNEILEQTKKNGNNKLILIALGMTATVLAYDLAKIGYQAIDIGHIDIEYEWFRMKATEKCAIPNKAVNEVKNGYLCSSLLDEKYESQIVAEIYDS